MFHCMFSTTFKLVQPQFVPIYTVGLFQLRAMASSSPTTSIPIQEPVFLQFLHDVHHAYLLLHRAMALLPPTLIPNIEPTPLPSTDVWNQPEGLRPIYSDQTNAFIDAVHFPSPDHADEEALMDDLLEPNLPEPHQHVAAPPPDALPDPSKLSTTASTPPKRKQKAKATPKAPAKRRRLHEQSRSRSPSPLTNWTADEKQKLRTLKSDEKSRFSWRVISTKMGKSEADVRSMWNKLKDTLGWVPEMCKRKKGFTAETFHHLRKAAVYVSPSHVANVYFHPLTTLLPLSHPLLHRWPPWTFWTFIVHMPSAILLCLSAFTWIDIVSSEPWPATTSRPPDDHALRPEHLLPLWVPHRSSSTGLDTSIYYTPSTGHPAIGFETYATIGSQKSVLQHLGTQGRRQPLHWNIWQPFPDLQSDLPRLRPQSFCFGLENRGDRYHSTKMVDTPSSHRLLHDDRYGPRSPDAWWSSPLSFGHLELVLSFLEDSPTPRCLHVSRVLTSCADTTSRSTWYGLCCTNSSDSSRASFRYGNEIYKNCRLNLETHSCQPRKEMKTGTLLEIFVPFRWKSWLPIFYLLTPSFLEFHRSYFLLMMFFSNLILDLHSGIFRLQIAFELIFIPPLHGEPHGWWLTPDASSTLFDELDQYHWPIFTIWWSNLGIVYSPCGQNDSNFYHRPHYFHQEDHLPLHFSTWWTLDLGTDRRWQRNLEACWNIFGKHAPHAWPSDTTHHRQPMAPVLRHTRPLILLLYGNTISGSSTSWTYQRPCLTTIWGHTGSTTHSPILLGTLCSTSLTRYNYIFILATMEIYTTILTISNTSPNPSLEHPYYTFTSSSSTSTTWRTGPYGYVWLQRVTHHSALRQ